MSEQDPQPCLTSTVDREQPWLGLDSFSEQTRAFFYGRDDEIAELARRVQRKTLTILFGQSGLGKTSILRAGIVPRLRPQGYCPVYVRIDYAEQAPDPAEQIKQAILRAAMAQGRWTQSGVADSGESLWEFLHHRDDILLDVDGRALIPLLIFDQFEEIFTLAQSDDAGKQRAARFLGELADLVENRAPQALEARIDADDALIERFDFARDDYRILLSLREDYLAHLEGLRTSMPSVTQNRMRLARMTGAQALSAVLKPGGRLVSEEVGAAIVRFIAGGAELANAEVEPSLLSLICRELNNNRIAQGRSEISTDLLAGTHASILSEFYQRALQDMPDGVHVVIEEQLLTEAGYRENLAEERVLKAFAFAGASPNVLSTLVNRRLLRIEERLDVRRVELTHDVLCGVVRAAREQRHERTAKEMAQAQLQQQQEEQHRTRQALVRARKVAVGGLTLAALALAASVYGYVSTRQAVQTRGEAEKLVGYLLDDYYEELRPVGRLDLVGELGARAVTYYKGLPEGMRNAETERNRTMALVRLGSVKYQQASYIEATALLDQAVSILETSYKAGNRSERNLADLAEAIYNRARIDELTGKIPQALRMERHAAELLQPLASTVNALPATRRIYAAVLTRAGWCQLRSGHGEDAIVTLRIALAAVSAEASLKDDVAGTAEFINASAWLYEALVHEDHSAAEMEAVSGPAMLAATQVLERRPGHFQVMDNQVSMLLNQTRLALKARQPGAAIRSVEQSLIVQEALVRVDVRADRSWGNLSISHLQHILPHWRAGHVKAAIDHAQQALAIYRDRKPSTFQEMNLRTIAWLLSVTQAETGNHAGAAQAMKSARQYLGLSPATQNMPAEDLKRRRVTLQLDLVQADNERILGDAVTLAESAALVARAEQIARDRPAGESAEEDDWLRLSAWMLDAKLAMQAGDYAHAEASAAKGAQLPFLPQPKWLAVGMERAASLDIVRALALVQLQRNVEAQALVSPLIASHRKLLADGADDQYVRVDLASSLLASALSRPSHRATELKEAQELLDRLPAEMQSLKTIELWKSRVRDAMLKHS